jgi:manganese efflux pump family protein
MEYLTIFLIAIGLCFDSFAVSVSSGLIRQEITFNQALRIAISLAFFQGMMPLAGWLLGTKLTNHIGQWDHWIAFTLLAALGGKMLYESLFVNEEEKDFDPLNFWVIIGMSIATSIDALIVGFTLAIVSVTIFESVIIIGFVTFLVSMLGILFGKKSGNVLGKKVEILGALILIGIGVKFLIEHLLFH